MEHGTTLVTGANGFVGHWLVQALVESGEDVVGAYRDRALGEIPAPSLFLDLLEPAVVEDVLAQVRPRRIYHLAGMAAPHQAQRDPLAAYRVNFLGTVQLLESCRRLEIACRVVIAGSATIYGIVAPEDLPLREDRPLAPRDSYGVSKAAVELLAGAYPPSIEIINCRAFNHTGPGQGEDFALPAFAAQLARIEAGVLPPILRVGDLSPERDFLHVRDVISAYRTLMDRGVPGQAYNICSGESRSMRVWLDHLIAQTHVPVEVAVDPERLRPTNLPALRGDNSRLRALGWAPATPPETLASELLESWRRRISRSGG